MSSNKKSGGKRKDSSQPRIDLPALGKSAAGEIVRENLYAMQTLYFAAMLEELRLFQVVDRLVALFGQGMLPVGKGQAGQILYRYWKRGVDRLTDAKRRNLYARAFGLPGSDHEGRSNREFGDLWLRFISAVTSHAEQLRVDTPLPSRETTASQEQVRRSGRDLAANLSLHGYGLAYFAARELEEQIQEIIRLLSDNEIKNAFEARDMWQVIDQVAALAFGGSPNLVRHRTRANAGATIIRWLANRRNLLLRPRPVPILKDDDVGKRRTGRKPSTHPTDYDLVNACEQWLAVSGPSEAQVQGHAQAGERPVRHE